jgi:hypothetical protein
VKVQTILDQIDVGAMALPEFQRGYVWNRDQVRGLMESLYRKHPVGGLLVWVTRTENADARGDGTLQPGSVKLLLDGQQRITSLYGIVRGAPPKFFQGNAQAFSGLYFDVEGETFEFYAPLKMKDSPLWVNVTELMQNGIGGFVQRIIANPLLAPQLTTYLNRLNAVATIKDLDLHIEEVTGEDKTVDVVVDIFNRVNSGGTKLSKGDLALAKVCAQWPDARHEMRVRLEKWRAAGFEFRLEWLLRNINTIVTGEALFSALKDVDTPSFQKGLVQAEQAVDTLLNLIAGRLGLDHDRVLGSRYSFPLLARYLTLRGSHFASAKEQDRVLHWYVHTFLWGRYAGSTETVLNQDLAAIERGGDPLDHLMGQLRQNRGDLRLSPEDFVGWSMSARFYPLLYMLTRVCKARDWDTGWDLTNYLLGKHSRLEVHHIFPKALLYKHDYTRAEVNAIANFTFLTQQTNLLVSDRDPSEYLPAFASKHPGVLESHWIPMDPALWKVEHYNDFLAARRELLAKAANDFLDSLVAGVFPHADAVPPITERPVVLTEHARTAVPGGPQSEEEEQHLQLINEWVAEHGLPRGEFAYELLSGESGAPLAILDLAWPNGLQEGYSDPVALLLDDPTEAHEAANSAGYRYFTDAEAFRDYVEREILAMAA